MGAPSKWVIVIPDGMYDHPQESLGGCTPLEAADTPVMDRLAAEGVVGRLQTVPEGFTPGSDVAILTILGCDVERIYCGRAPFEAAAMGIELASDEWAFRMNLVTVVDDVLDDFSAGHIETSEARRLVEALEGALGDADHKFYAGVSYRHIMTRKGPAPQVRASAPHDVMGRKLSEVFPKGADAGEFIRLMERSREILENHPVNAQRARNGRKSANMIWLWSGGPKPDVPTFRGRFGLSGACISAVDLVKGVGKILGWKYIPVEGATGYLDTDYEAKGRAAVAAMEEADLVFVHVEAPDEAGHEGDAKAKTRAIARVDESVLAPIVAKAKGIGSARIAVLGDHYTPVAIRTHSAEPVPFVVWGEGVRASGVGSFSEANAAEGPLFIRPGCKFLERFLRGEF